MSARGRGTTIEIYLPCVPAAAAAPAVASVAETSVASGRVLLVEDDISVRSVVMRELMSRGYDVSEASDGKSALERARATPPIDIVITDLAMPQMDGLELARQLEISHPTLPILFISGHPDDQSMQIVRSGRPFLQKPFTGEELVTRLEELLHGTR